MERAELAKLLARHIGKANPAEGGGSPMPRVVGGDLLVDARDPAAFRSSFAMACAARTGRVVLCDPGWANLERTKLIGLLARSREAGERGWLCVATGGSSGELKLSRHDGGTIASAVRGYRDFFGVDKVRALSVLPLNHVSGFMAWMRCELTGGSMQDAPWREIEAGARPAVAPGTVISLVPTQLQRLLKDASAADWLRSFETVFLGGGPAWPSLLDAARTAGLRLSMTYGMTETAAMVAALPVEEFVAGSSGAMRPLPHATFTLDPDGSVCIGASSLFFGYTGGADHSGVLRTEDLGTIDAKGGIHIEGRRDAMIITGGKKVAPAEVEAAILGAGRIEEIAVLGLPDAEWGQAVCACVPSSTSREAIDATIAAIEGELAPWKQPKRWIQVAEWPRDEKGKLNRAMLRAQLRPFTGPCGSCELPA